MTKEILKSLGLKPYCDGEHPKNGCDFEKVDVIVSQTLKEIRQEIEGMKEHDKPWFEQEIIHNKAIDQVLQVIDKHLSK